MARATRFSTFFFFITFLIKKDEKTCPEYNPLNDIDLIRIADWNRLRRNKIIKDDRHEWDPSPFARIVIWKVYVRKGYNPVFCGSVLRSQYLRAVKDMPISNSIMHEQENADIILREELSRTVLYRYTKIKRIWQWNKIKYFQKFW